MRLWIKSCCSGCCRGPASISFHSLSSEGYSSPPRVVWPSSHIQRKKVSESLHHHIHNSTQTNFQGMSIRTETTTKKKNSYLANIIYVDMTVARANGCIAPILTPAQLIQSLACADNRAHDGHLGI